MFASPNTVIMLIGNKIDLEDARSVSYEEAKKWADENCILHQFCSHTSPHTPHCTTHIHTYTQATAIHFIIIIIQISCLSITIY
jgi:hypothetical protein